MLQTLQLGWFFLRERKLNISLTAVLSQWDRKEKRPCQNSAKMNTLKTFAKDPWPFLAPVTLGWRLSLFISHSFSHTLSVLGCYYTSRGRPNPKVHPLPTSLSLSFSSHHPRPLPISQASPKGPQGPRTSLLELIALWHSVRRPLVTFWLLLISHLESVT